MSASWKKIPSLGLGLILLLLVACWSPVSPSPAVDETPTVMQTSTVEQVPTTVPPTAVKEMPTMAPATTVDQVLRITARELKSRLDDGQEILVVDARSADNYKAKHISGAISMPLDELEARYDELPRTGAIVFYCT